MIELSQHIEALLLENDCVIVPGLGGFVAHYTPAMRVEEENIFLPPTRIIGFNPQLKMNDGLLVQSVMAVYDTSFSDATRMVDREVNRLLSTLHEDGKADLPNVGELRYSIHDTYDFIPYDNKITTPYLYGLDSFEMKELTATRQSAPEKAIPFAPVAAGEKKRRFEFKLNRSYLTNAAAMIAVIVLFFLSTPVENTEVTEGNYAQLLPEELFGKIEKQSLVIHPIIVHRPTDEENAPSQQASSEKKKKKTMPIAVKEVKVGRQATFSTSTPATETKAAAVATAVPSKSYHIIVASVGTEKDARAMAKQLLEKGFDGAKAIIGDGKMRVSIESCTTEAEAYRTLNKIRQQESYQNAWVLKKK